MPENLNLYQRVNEVRKKINYVQKTASVQGYRAVTHDEVTAQVRNHLIEYGVIIVPSLVQSQTLDVGKTKSGATIVRYEGVYDVRFVNADNPEELLTMRMEGHANDSGDKAPGKATSYATKYAILKLFNIETGENEESRHEAYADYITAEQAQQIEQRIIDYKVDKAGFSSWLKQQRVENGDITKIRANAFETVISTLEKKKPKGE